ncbi:hypothetical protein HQ393_14730 [Chitinibacter bivalviorum]|uniref:DUF4760 domain-containing protein n=1 Tax=Chitinibacter bivalviorum TaxID=2739434 RepID=A0A7H9BL46_9NEIS|nr:hypothetical protein [Chitinibacter bivalviorum]QLG89400.1 hypothetical protein HQ393_14730 [Chitinibacter bivalviorum]
MQDFFVLIFSQGSEKSASDFAALIISLLALLVSIAAWFQSWRANSIALLEDRADVCMKISKLNNEFQSGSYIVPIGQGVFEIDEVQKRLYEFGQLKSNVYKAKYIFSKATEVALFSFFDAYFQYLQFICVVKSELDTNYRNDGKIIEKEEYLKESRGKQSKVVSQLRLQCNEVLYLLEKESNVCSTLLPSLD